MLRISCSKYINGHQNIELCHVFSDKTTSILSGVCLICFYFLFIMIRDFAFILISDCSKYLSSVFYFFLLTGEEFMRSPNLDSQDHK